MKALNLLIKPASGSCNMRCRYCFYEDVTDSRLHKNRGMMSLETLEVLVKAALSETTHACTFGFQGGEPTLVGLHFYHALIEMQKRYNVNRVQIMNTIQTNGLLIDEQWAQFLAKHQFLTGLSIDGPKDTHDALRLDAEGKGTHNRAMRAAQLLRRHGAEFNILSVVTRELASHPDRAYGFYKKNGFRYVQFIPCMDELNAQPGMHAHSLSSEMYGRFLCRTFDLWYDEIARGEALSVRMFDNYVQMLMGYPPESCAMAGRCTASLLVEADGEVYPCDFYALDEYRMGSILSDGPTELLSSEAAQRFVAPSLAVNEACQACEFYRLCRGGCRRDREPIREDMPSLNRYCGAYKQFFAGAMPRLQRLAQYFSERNYIR